MKLRSHLVSIIVILVAALVFWILRDALEFRFGFRTYWPMFICLYLIVWYYADYFRENLERGIREPGQHKP